MPVKFRINYLLIPLLVIITASASSYFADIGRVWYKTINLPNWTPPNSFMVIAWIIVFILTSISVLIIWNKFSKEKNFHLIIALFAMNALINVGWNILFFTQQQIGLAFFEAVLLMLNLILLIILIRKFSPFAAALLLPYSVWVFIATLLSLNVWILN